MKKTRVLIVEDSLIMRKVISDIFLHEQDFEIIAAIGKGKEALERIPGLKPDIITLDINLPDMYGLNVLNEIMTRFPTRVVMLSAYTQKGAEITMKALELGALDFIPKPSGEISFDLFNFKDDIVSKMRIIADIDVDKYLSSFKGVPVVDGALAVKKVVVIAASTGGPKAVMEVVKNIPADIGVCFLIVQHMPEGFTRTFAERLSWYSNIKVKEAEDGDLILKGAGYVAPAGFHMVMKRAEGKNNRFRICLDDSPRVNFVKPSADIALESAAELFGSNTIGVILTGMGKDGLKGARKVKEKGGVIIAQDQDTSIVYGMPKAVADAGLADEVLSLSRISEEIINKVGYYG